MGQDQSQPSIEKCDGQEATVDPDPIVNLEHWSLHHAQLRSPPTPLSAFVALKKSPQSKQALQSLSKNLRQFRHPHILRYIKCTQCPSQGLQLLTEKASPLSVVRKQQSPSQICLGLQKIALALDFLHRVAGVSHGNVELASIFVTPEGNWRLAGIISKGAKKASDFDHDLENYNTLVEFLIKNVKKVDHDEVPSLEEFMKHRFESFEQILSAPLFTSCDLVQLENFLVDLPMKSPEARRKFFAEDDLVDRLRSLPAILVAVQLAPLLLSRLVLLESSAVENFLPQMLKPRGEEAEDEAKTSQVDGILPADLFKEKIIPLLINIFQVREMQIRRVLLKLFAHYVKMFTLDQLEDQILPLVLLGIRDANDQLVAETLQVLAILVPILGAEKVIGKKRRKMFADGSPSKSLPPLSVAVAATSAALAEESLSSKSRFDSLKKCTVSTAATDVTMPEESERQSPIGAETSDEELANAVGRTLAFDEADDWEPWEEDPDEPEEKRVDALMSANASPQTFSSNLPEAKIVSGSPFAKEASLANKNDEASTIIAEPDFFEDMQPVIETNRPVFVEDSKTTSGINEKFAVLVEGVDDDDGWNDDAWSS